MLSIQLSDPTSTFSIEQVSNVNQGIKKYGKDIEDIVDVKGNAKIEDIKFNKKFEASGDITIKKCEGKDLQSTAGSIEAENCSFVKILAKEDCNLNSTSADMVETTNLNASLGIIKTINASGRVEINKIFASVVKAPVINGSGCTLGYLVCESISLKASFVKSLTILINNCKINQCVIDLQGTIVEGNIVIKNIAPDLREEITTSENILSALAANEALEFLKTGIKPSREYPKTEKVIKSSEIKIDVKIAVAKMGGELKFENCQQGTVTYQVSS